MNDTIRWYSLEPVDAWFFRDGRPSNRGEDQSDLESQFPPHPPTVVGALRAALARGKGWDGCGNSWSDCIKVILGDGFENLGALAFTGPFLQNEGGLLFPLPRHVVGKTQEQDEKKTFEASGFLRPSLEPIRCDAGTVRLPEPPPHVSRDSKPAEQPSGFFVTVAGMQCILAGELPESGQCLHADALFRREPRIGIERDAHSLTTGKNAMYSPHYVRLQKGVSLAVGIDGLPDGWTLPEVFPLGGESRMAVCTRLETPPSLPQPPPRSGNALLVLLTPACFDTPWWGAGPGESASQLSGDVGGAVVTTAINRPVSIGGWDSRKGEPLPMRPHAPPGSVWWLEDASVPNASLEPLELGKRTPYGFGMALAGVWPATTE